MLRQTGCAGVIVGRGCLGRPWLFRELAEVFDGREPGPPPNFAQVCEILFDHAELLIDFFGETVGIRQLRKWCTWYTIGFRHSARARGELVRVNSLAEIRRILARGDPDEPFPVAALRAHRAKGGRTQKVVLPEGYLETRGDDRPPRGPRSSAEIDAFEKALQGG